MRQYEVRAGLLGGAIAGVLDMTDPIVFYGCGGWRQCILQSVASGLFEPAAY